MSLPRPAILPSTVPETRTLTAIQHPLRRARPVAGTRLALPLAAAALAAGLGAARAQGTADDAPRRGGVIQYGHVQEPPCLYGSWIQQWYLQRQFSDALVARRVDGSIAPWLATAWAVSDDRTVYTFEIKPDVSFTDGTPLDAKAVADNFALWLGDDPDRRNNAASLYFKEHFTSAEATGPRTVRVTLKRPYAPFLTVLSHATLGILSPTALARGLQANCERPVGSGPFVVETWNHGENVVFRRNPNYNSAPATAKHQGPAYVDGLVWKFLKEPTIRYGSLTAGESDVIYDVPAVDFAEASRRFTIVRHITGGTPQRLQLNTEFPPFDDARVRRAFAHATDRKGAVAAIFRGAVPYEGNPVLASSAPDYDAEAAGLYPYDPAAANRLLDEAGWTGRGARGTRAKDGRPLTVRVAYGGGYLSPDAAQAIEIIQEQAREVGFDVQLKPTPQADWLAGRNRGPRDYEIIPAYWTASSAEVFKISWKPDQGGVRNANNASRLQSAEAWDLIQRADGTADDAARKALYGQAQRLLAESAAVIGFVPLPVTLASRPDLKDVWLSGAVGEPVFHDAWFAR